MKKSLFLSVTSLFSACLFLSCASTKISISDYSPVGILGVEGNPTILAVDFDNQKDEDAGGTLSNAINKLIDGKNPEILTAQDRVDFAEECLRHALEEIAGVEVVDKEKITQSENYKYAKLNILSMTNTNCVAAGYQQDMLSLGAKKARVLMQESGAKGLISLEFEFDKKLSKKELYAVVKMKVRFIGSNGREILNKEFVEESTEKIKVHGLYDSNYDKDTFVTFYPPIIESIINKFVLEYMN